MVKLVTLTKVEVCAGICGFKTDIDAMQRDNYKASFTLDSECPNWNRVNEILGNQELDIMKELFKDKATGMLNSKVLETVFEIIPHVSCPVISGVLKALEVSVGLALPKDASIKFIE